MVNFNKKIINPDKFRTPCKHFQQHGVYCFYPHGTTEYLNFWEKESDYCVNGFTAADGDWISGYNYWYLNYCPILRLVEFEYKDKHGNIKKRREKTREFPDFYDYDYYYFLGIDEAEEEGKHMVVLKARGKGYSFKGSSMLTRNFYHIPESKSYAIASESEYLVRDGILSKAWDLMDFIDEHTAWAKKRQAVNTKIHKRASILTTDAMGNKIEVGYKSEIIGVTLKNDANKARGKRGKLILFEEAGSFKDILQAWQIARPSVEEDGVAFGLMLAFGTGGDEASRFDGLKELFYNPSGYNVKAFPNIWDEGASGNTCAFFVPVYANMSVLSADGKRIFMDKYGNTLRDKAVDYSLEQRQRVIDGSSDSRAIDRYIAENPITPQEAVLELTGNIFPKKELMIQLAALRTNKKLQNFKQVGDLNFINGELMWTPKKGGDITKYPLGKDDAHEGSIVIWEHPVKDAPHALYIAGCLTPGEKVLTNSGIKDVESITLDDMLINKDGEEVKINTLLRYEKENEPTYKISMSNVDRPTNYTQEHPLYVSDSPYSEFNFIRARDVKNNMWTKVPNTYASEKAFDINIWNKYKSKRNGENKLLDEDFWWFVGQWLGDGFNNKSGLNYTIYNSFGLSESDYIKKYKDIVSRLFDRSANLKLQNGSGTHKFEHKQLYLFLEDNFGKYADGKYISEWVKFIPSNLKKHLILGYLDADGSVYRDRGMVRSSFKSINRRLLNDVQDILFSIGIKSSFSLGEKASTYLINGKSGKTKESYSLRLNQIELKKFSDLFGFDYGSRKLKLAKDIVFKQKPKKSNSCIISGDNKYIYIKISNISKSSYSGTVYNFDCDTHTFVTQYCTGHNCDPYDHDKAGTNSLGSTFIYKRFQNFESYYDMLVAEYTGRPDTAEDYYENVRKLLMYYNARLLYENERKGIFPYFTQKHCDYLLADQPDIINDIIGKSTVQRRKGIHMNVQIKDYGEGLIKEWLNEEFAPGKKNLTKIMSEALLEELIQYNTKGNFDRVIALIMVMIYRLQMHNTYVKKRDSDAKKINLFDKPLFSKDWFSGTSLSELSDIDLNTNTKEIKWL